MKTTIIVYALTLILIALITPARPYDLPKTIRLFNNITKETVGTMTLHGNRGYLRDRNGEHYATIVQNTDGTKTMYDPNGKVIEASSLSLPKLPE